MKIAIIGSGNVATVLTKKIKKTSHTIIQIVGRNIESTSNLAQKIDSKFCTDLRLLTQNANLYIIAVQDKEIENITQQIKIPTDSILVHTAGGVSIDILQHKNIGVLYPLQSLNKNSSENTVVPFFVDANNENTKSILVNFAKTISNKVAIASDEKRLNLHIAAVFANNFTNYLYELSNNFCAQNGIDFSYLLPIIEETTNRLHYINPSEVQTGPAIRGDLNTMRKHLSVLHNNTELVSVYQFLSEKIHEHFKN